MIKDPPPPHKPFSERHPVLLICLILIACLSIAETAAWGWIQYRVGYVGPHQAASYATEQFDHYTFYKYNARTDGFIMKDGHNCVPGGMSHFKIDENGLHTPQKGLVPKKKKNEIRIAFFGGSTMFGIGAPNTAKTIAAVVQQKLTSLFPLHQIRIINAGMRGFLSMQELLFYWSQIRKFSPDIVISFSGHNDGSFAAFIGNQDEEQPLKTSHHMELEKRVNQQMTWVQDGTLSRAPTQRVFQELVLRTNIGTAISLIAKRYNLSTESTDQQARTNSFTQMFNKDWADQRAKTFLTVQEDFQALARKDGAVFLSVIQPAMLTQRTPTKEEKKCLAIEGTELDEMRTRYIYYQNKILAAARYRPWMHDFTGIFTNIDQSVYVDQIHYNQHGQFLIADLLVKKLISEPQTNAILKGKAK
jgi:hypothetical protein